MKLQTTIRNLMLVTVALVTVQCGQKETFYSNILRNDVFYQLYDNHAYDFLWVFDNSGSMTNRRVYVRDNMQNFVNILNSRKAIDFQMAVTTTDMFTNAGNLVKGVNNLEVAKSTSVSVVGDMASIIDNVVDSPTSFWEQGLESAYQAMYKHKAKFSRPGVPLVMIVLTDENDYSCAENCYGVEPENNPNWIPFDMNRYINYFQNVKASEDAEVHFFPIVGLQSSICTVASLGARYLELATALGGLSEEGSICSSQLQDAYEGIARILADRGIRFQLSSQASGKGINVYVDSKLVPYSADNGFVYESETNSIVFTGNAVPSNGSIIEVAYNEKAN